MKLSELIVLPFLAQGLAMFVDEFYFHHKRGLPRWERIGHPLDTMTVFFCYFVLLNFQPSAFSLKLYIGFCLFSCLFITKDEFVHTEHSSGAENWLHSVLFILHPIVFFVAGLIWFQKYEVESVSEFLWQSLKIQTGLTVCFFFYQIIYWSLLSKQKLK